MKFSFAFLVIVICIFVQSSDACCKVEGLGTCCGHGPCNIFCCNCDDGCKPKAKCSLSFARVLDQIKTHSCRNLSPAARQLVELVDNSDKDISKFALDACKEYILSVPMKKRDVSSVLEDSRVRRAANQTFVLVDTDKSGSISLKEARDYLERDGKIRKIRAVKSGTLSWFTHMDSNGDGMISPYEFDRRL